MFIVMGLPRSRTTWLARFLSYRDFRCGHDEIQHMRSLEDVRAWFTQPCTGSAETGAAPFWRLLLHYAPGIKVVTVRRPVADVLASIARAGISDDTGTVAALVHRENRKLDQIEKRIPGVLSVTFDDLAQEAVCAKIFEHCLPHRHDHDWWRSWDKQIVSGDLIAQARYCQAYLPQLLKLTRTAKQRMLALMEPSSEPPAGFTFQEEDFETWYRDAVPLFREHLETVGEDVENYENKNLPLFRHFDKAGALQIMTARSNGRMFGYLLSLIGPTLEDRFGTMANNLTFFVSKHASGLGMKLQIASREALKRKGVDELFCRAGVRGDGPRLGAMYRRMGMEEYGEIYREKLTENISWGS